MGLNSLYRQYFQKSKIFLYPLLDIKRGSFTYPPETYISWEGKYTINDSKLICVYNTIHSPEFIQFENNILMKNTRLCDYFKINSTTSAFVFEFSDLKENWTHFTNGCYSKIDQKLKVKILNHFSNNKANQIYIDSYLFPDKYRKDYANLLDVELSLLEQTVELCDKPNLIKETLLIKIPDLENLEILG